MIDSRGIEYVVHEGKHYYSSGNAAKYLGMTDTGFRRKRERLEHNDGIIIPLALLPVSDQMRFVDKRVLDALNAVAYVGEEEQWNEELRRVVKEINDEKVPLFTFATKTSETTSNHSIILREEEDGYASVRLELPSPVDNVQFTFTSVGEAQAFVGALKKTIRISGPLIDAVK